MVSLVKVYQTRQCTPSLSSVCLSIHVGVYAGVLHGLAGFARNVPKYQLYQRCTVGQLSVGTGAYMRESGQ